MSSSSSSSSKQDLKVENTSEINKEEEKKPITTPKQESPPQAILSENAIPVCPNLEIPTAKTEKDTIQNDPPKDDDKLFICMNCKKEFPTSDTHKKDLELLLERKQKLIQSILLSNSREGGGSSSSNSPFLSFNVGSSSSSTSNTAFPMLVNGGVITEMKTTIYKGLYLSGPNYGGGGSSSTNSKPLFGSGVTRGVSSMFSTPTPNRFFTGSTSYRTYRPKPIDYSSFIGGSNKNKKSVGSWVSGEVPREMIDLNKPPCSFVDLESDDDDDDDDDDDKGKAKRDLEGDVKGIGMLSWGMKKRRTR